MRLETMLNEWRRIRGYVHEPDERGILADWHQEEGDQAWFDMYGFQQLLGIVPEKVAANLEKARLAREGLIPMYKAGLGYEECVNSIVADGTAIASSSAEARLVPAVLLNPNFWQPYGTPGRTIAIRARGRQTTLTTAATMIFRLRGEATDVITGTAWAASGGITQDTTVQTATQWRLDCGVTARTVGTAGTVFAQGDASMASAAVTIANQTAQFMGSAGSATPATVAKDMTLATYLNLTGQWSLATAYSITCHRYTVEVLN